MSAYSHALMPQDSEAFAARLVEPRRAKGFSQEEAAHEIGVSHRQFARWEAAEATPRPPMLRAIADALGTDVPSLLGLETPEALQVLLGRIIEVLESIDAKIGRLIGSAPEEEEPSPPSSLPPS